MNYLVTNPFCPYCYGNDRLLEREVPNLNDDELELLPMNLTPDVQVFDEILYEKYKKNFETQTIPYLKTLNITMPKFFKLENVSKTDLVFISYYYLRNFNLGIKFYHEVTSKFYTDDLNFSDTASLAKIVEKLGHDPQKYLEAIKDDTYKNIYLEKLAMVEDAEVEVVPTYIINEDAVSYPDIKTAIKILKEINKEDQ